MAWGARNLISTQAEAMRRGSGLSAGELVTYQLYFNKIQSSYTVHKSNCRGATPPLLNHDLHAIDATPARWRGVVVYFRSFQPTRSRFRREMTE
jgi:hypothetical protein